MVATASDPAEEVRRPTQPQQAAAALPTIGSNAESYIDQQQFDFLKKMATTSSGGAPAADPWGGYPKG